MGIFNNRKVIFDTGRLNIENVLADFREYFEARNYEVESELLGTGGAHVSLTNSNLFKSALGLKTALNVAVEPRGNNWHVETSVGVFGQQVIPTVIMLFIAWPVLVAQIWGLVKQARLDDEAIQVIEDAMRRHAETQPAQAAASTVKVFCTECGQDIPGGAKFCPQCGTRIGTVPM